MPSRDSDGKRLPGSEMRKPMQDFELSETARSMFLEIGPPPVEDPDSLLIWGRRVLATSTWLTMIGELDSHRAKTLKDQVFAIGATHSRAAIEDRTKKLEKALQARRDAGGSVVVKPGSQVKRPPTARGMRTGPRPMPRDESEAEAPAETTPDGDDDSR